jgi:hypothetical protein
MSPAAVDAVSAALSSAFLRPLGLAALAAAIPVVLLYLRKPDPTRVAFPAVEFLLGDSDESRSRPAFRRLRRNAGLALQLFAIAALAVSLAAPYVSVSEERTVEETVLVVDRSASMATQSECAIRFDRAVAAAKDEVSAETSVVVSGADTGVTARRVPPAEARDTLDDLGVTGAPGDLSGAIERATAGVGVGRVRRGRVRHRRARPAARRHPPGRPRDALAGRRRRDSGPAEPLGRRLR